jgi:hypothetical protein
MEHAADESRQRSTVSLRRSIIMSAGLHSTEINRRRHRKEKRDKLRAQLAAAPAAGRAAIEAKLLKTYPLGSGPQPSKSKAGGAGAAAVAPN